MRTFLISYDLAAPKTNKNAISEAIMAVGKRWARPLDQSWYVQLEDGADLIDDALAHLIDDEDGLLVQEVSGSALMTNTSVRWFKQRGADADNVVNFPRADAAQISVEIDFPMAEAS